ncbi:MAG TPA: geranylgeranylglycerol-phosphate geranylgeranyltransferase [Chitinophagaceae bacterium]|nr:geranylgeranylglycerol-phosphate geranylgeranyltransferase [Chitinophagaceae bacterium]
MKLLLAFLKLIRWPNIIFIGLTQCLFFYCILPFVYKGMQQISLSTNTFYLLVTASLCIAAAGYIINDYFDINIDLINKPGKLIIEKYIKRRWAIVLHLCLSFIGFLISCYVGYKLRNIYIPFFNLLSIVSLWFYSTTFKKKLLIGNVVISLLTAWVILVITVAEYKLNRTVGVNTFVLPRLLKVSFLYAGFAFIISLIREVVKDMEDIQGDVKYGCETMPIVWGIPVSKVFAAVWLVVLTGGVAILQFYVLQLGWWLSAIYCILLIIIPLVWILQQLYKAQVASDFSKLSKAIKIVMLTGIISMIFFRIYL